MSGAGGTRTAVSRCSSVRIRWREVGSRRRVCVSSTGVPERDGRVLHGLPCSRRVDFAFRSVDTETRGRVFERDEVHSAARRLGAISVSILVEVVSSSTSSDDFCTVEGGGLDSLDLIILKEVLPV